MSERAEILAIGDELIHGHGLDTNAPWIARALEAVGARLARFTVVSDDVEDIAAAIAQACARARLLVATGGLGPTEDDRTRQAAAAAAGTKLRFDPASWQQIEARFARLGRKPTESNRLQAFLPENAVPLENHWGTAPGFRLDLGPSTLFALPGVPHEMREMLRCHVLPALPALLGHGATAFLDLHAIGITEAELGERIAAFMAHDHEPRVGITAHFGQLTIRIAARGDTPQAASLACETTAVEIRPLVGDHLVYEGPSSLHEVLVRELIEQRITLALAESCTGGLLATYLTEVSGISAVLLTGVVTYADESKMRELGVPAEVLARHGAVSPETAAAMASGIAARAGARLGLAITGIAGPDGGSPEKPVGTVCFGLCLDGTTSSWQRRLPALGRSFVRERAVLEILAAAHRRLQRPS